MDGIKTRPVGEQFEEDGVLLEVTEHPNCGGCYFIPFWPCCAITLLACSETDRTDGKSVVFKKVIPPHANHC